MSIEVVSRAKLIVGFHRKQGCMPRSAPTPGKFSILPWPENTPSLTVVLPCPAPPRNFFLIYEYQSNLALAEQNCAVQC